MSRLARVIERCAISQCRIAPRQLKCAGPCDFSGIYRFAGCGKQGIFLSEVRAAMTLCFHMFSCCSIIEPMGFFLLSCKPMHGSNMKSAGRQRQLKCAEPRVFVGMCHFVGRKDRGRKRICLADANSGKQAKCELKRMTWTYQCGEPDKDVRQEICSFCGLSDSEFTGPWLTAGARSYHEKSERGCLLECRSSPVSRGALVALASPLPFQDSNKAKLS